uniref:Uncharacterized protein n=1 Tax=Rhizophora mucronata TaxID=61149 RepID=A0A2P2NR16_RHIMU
MSLTSWVSLFIHKFLLGSLLQLHCLLMPLVCHLFFHLYGVLINTIPFSWNRNRCYDSILSYGSGFLVVTWINLLNSVSHLCKQI